MTPDEREVVEAALAGGEAAFEALIRLYSRRVYAVAYAILQDRCEAEDTVQDTFLKAYNTRSRLREPEKIAEWLCMIARNRARDLLRKRRVRSAPEALATENCFEMPPIAGNDDDLHLHLRSLLAKLPETHRTALTLRYMEDMDHRSIEQTMGLTSGALRGILGRALSSIRKGMKIQPHPFGPEAAVQ